MMSIYTIRVGWSSQRPFINDQHIASVAVSAPDGFAGAADARTAAAHLVASVRAHIECHVTSVTIIEQEV